MSLIASGTMLPNRQISNIIVTEGVAAEVGANDIAIYALDNVPLYKQLEIFNAWRWLWNGVRDRNLLDSQFVGAILYTYSNINILTENDRRTSSALIDLNPEDVVIGIGLNVTTDFRGAVTPLETGFEKLRHAALEQFLKAA